MMQLGLGTAAIGRPQYININQEPSVPLTLEAFRQKGLDILESAYQQGLKYFDTAPGYGMAEQLLIEWYRSKNDPSIEIATKWGYTYVANFDPKATTHEVKEHSLSKLNEQWKQSNLLLPALSTYQIHSATFETGVLDNQDILNRLAELKASKHIRIGLTTTGANQTEVLKKALDIEVGGKLLFDVFQVSYNIFDQSLASIIDHFSTADNRLIIKEALANGRVFPNQKYPHYSRAYDKLTELAQTYQVGIDAIALRFCMDSIPAFKVLSGASKIEHLSDNLKAENFKLTAAQIQSLKELAIAPEQYWKERKQLSWN